MFEATATEMAAGAVFKPLHLEREVITLDHGSAISWKNFVSQTSASRLRSAVAVISNDQASRLRKVENGLIL